MAADDSSEHSEDSQAGAWPAVCDVCGFEGANSVMLYCCNYGEDHRVGCHSYCLAGHGVRGKKLDVYECFACMEYSRSVNDAVGKAHARASVEEMPELRRVQLGLRVRHGHEALAHPTEQQRIDHAAAAAAKAAKVRHTAELHSVAEEAEQHNMGPNKRRKLSDNRAAAAAAASRRGAAAGAGQLQKLGSAAAAAAAAAVGSGDEAGGGRAGRKRQVTVQKFIKGVNKGKAYDVRQAQDRARAAAAAAGGAPGPGRGRGRTTQVLKQDARAAAAAAAEADYCEDQHDAMDWKVQGGSKAAAAESMGQQRHHGQQHAGVRLGRHHRLGLQVQPMRYDRQLMTAKLHCRLVVLPKEGQPVQHQEPVDPENYLHVSGAFWESDEAEQEATPEQQEAHKQLLEDMNSELESQGQLTLMGGAFDLSAHPAIQRYMESPALSYRPLLFIPNTSSEKTMIFDLLGDPRRFVVMSIESKLLVLVPTLSGQMVAICPKHVANSQDLTNDVVQTIMAHPRLGCPSQDVDGGNHLRSPSESLLGPPETKDGIVEQQAAGPGQLQQQQQQHPQGSDAAGQAQSGIAGQHQQQQRLPVRNLPDGMRAEAAQGQDHGAGVQQQLGAAALPSNPHAPNVAVEPHAADSPQLRQAVVRAAAAAAAAAAAGVLSPAAAAAAVAAAAAAGSVPPGSTVSVAEAVEGSPLAQLLTWAHVGAGGAAERRQRHNKQAMTLRSCIPQLSDMSDVNSIRLFMPGFSQEMLDEGGRLYGPLKAARLLVDGVYTSPAAMDELLQDLCLLPAPSHPGSPSTAAPSSQQVYFTAPQGSLSADAAAAAAAPAAAAGATAGAEVVRQGSNEGLDLTGGPQDSCYRVLLVPEHFDSQALQLMLGQVPLWQLLACPVAIFKQGTRRGLLHHLQRLQKQRQAAAAADTISLRVPTGVALTTQLFRDELAIVADANALKHCSVEELQQLLLLLRRARSLLHAGADAELAVDNPVYIVLSQQDLVGLSRQQQEVLEEGLADTTVALLEDCLVSSDASANGMQDDPVVVAALQLAAQRQQELRHIIVLAPDINTAAATSVTSNTDASPAVRGGLSPVSFKGGAAGTGSRGAVSCGQLSQDAGDVFATRAVLRWRLEASARQPRLLAGTFSQLLQVLTCLVGDGCRPREQ